MGVPPCPFDSWVSWWWWWWWWWPSSWTSSRRVSPWDFKCWILRSCRQLLYIALHYVTYIYHYLSMFMYMYVYIYIHYQWLTSCPVFFCEVIMSPIPLSYHFPSSPIVLPAVLPTKFGMPPFLDGCLASITEVVFELAEVLSMVVLRYPHCKIR